jgi:hypothetical protein
MADVASAHQVDGDTDICEQKNKIPGSGQGILCEARQSADP